MKKVLCVLTCFALGVALMLTAAAAPDLNTVRVTRQPVKNLFVPYGGNIVLEIEAQAPAESGGTPLRYQWYQVSSALPQADPLAGHPVSGAQEAKMTMATGVLAIVPRIRPGNAVSNLYFRCVVTAALNDGTETVAVSETCWVRLYYGWDGAMQALRVKSPVAFLGNLLGLLSAPFRIILDWFIFIMQSIRETSL